MKITVVFDSLEEFQQHMVTRPTEEELYKKYDNFPDAAHVSGMRLLTGQETAEEQKMPEAEQKMPEAEQKMPEAEQKMPKAPRVEDVRKALAALNKKAGKNVAKELIASVGYKKLTEVPEGALVTLQSLIEEEEKNYA